MSKVDLMKKTHEQLEGTLDHMMMTLNSTKKETKNLESAMRYVRSVITSENQHKVFVFENFSSYF